MSLWLGYLKNFVSLPAFRYLKEKVLLLVLDQTNRVYNHNRFMRTFSGRPWANFEADRRSRVHNAWTHHRRLTKTTISIVTMRISLIHATLVLLTVLHSVSALPGFLNGWFSCKSTAFRVCTRFLTPHSSWFRSVLFESPSLFHVF